MSPFNSSSFHQPLGIPIPSQNESEECISWTFLVLNSTSGRVHDPITVEAFGRDSTGFERFLGTAQHGEVGRLWRLKLGRLMSPVGC